MSIKGNMKLYCERFLLLLKALHFNIYIPIIFINIIIPLLSLIFYLRKGINDEFSTNIYQLYQIFIPFLSCWWIIFILRFYYEEPWAEILFVNFDKNKLLDIFPLFLIMLLDITLTSLPYFFIIEKFSFYFLRIILVCFFYFGFSYSITMISKSITPTLIGLIVYTLSNIISPLPGTVFPFYYSPETLTNIFLCEVPLALAGIVLTAIGLYIIKHRQNS